MDITIGKNDVHKRIDAIMRAVLRDVPLSAIYKHIRHGLITLNNKKCSPSTRVIRGDIIQIQMTKIRTTTEQPLPSHLPYLTQTPENTLQPLNMALALFDNQYYLALNKPSGMPLFGTASLQEQVRYHLARELTNNTSLPRWGMVFKPSALHRLDRNTSGVIMFAKQIEAARIFGKLQRIHSITKHYITIVHGIIKKPTVWKSLLQRNTVTKKTIKAPQDVDTTVEARSATTTIKPLLWGDNITLIRCTITAGFTHQIRAQASIKQHPLIGDKKYYGYGKNYLLHCYALRFTKSPVERLPNTIYAPMHSKTVAMLNDLFIASKVEQVLSRLYNSQPYYFDC